MKALIVNGDDFGASRSINRAIIKAHREGILTSASLVVNGGAFDDAVEQAKNNPYLSVGIHLVLVQGRSTVSPAEIPYLVNSEGHFSNRPVLAGLKYFFIKSIKEQIEKELRAQLEKYISTNLKISHINSHLNIHMHPSIFDIVLKLAEEFDVKNIRLPKDDLFLNLKLDRSAIVYKLLHSLIFGILTRMYRKSLLKRGFRFTDVVYGLLQSGNMCEMYVSGLLNNLKDGTSEMYFHPDSFPSENWYGKSGNYRYTEEFHVLLSQRIKSIISKNSIRLVDYSFINF
ncbi:MAG: hopanoid biosynthesis-associated protein HpnK [Candidatus Scalinduaceae bacterium]